MTARFVFPLLALAALLAACAAPEKEAGRGVGPPPFLARESAATEPTGAIGDPTAAPGSPEDVNQRLTSLELDMAALKIEMSRVAEFDERINALEGGRPYSATKLEPAAPKPVLKIPKNAGEAALPAPELPAAAPAEKGAPGTPAPAPKAAPGAAQAGGLFGVQLAAYGSPAGAQKGWASLTAAAGPLLADLTPHREEATIAGHGIVQRLKAGPFPDPAAAKARCAALKSAGHACLVTDFSGVWP